MKQWQPSTALGEHWLGHNEDCRGAKVQDKDKWRKQALQEERPDTKIPNQTLQAPNRLSRLFTDLESKLGVEIYLKST